MTRDEWERLEPLVDAVLEQPRERRRAFIAEISGGNVDLAADLARFIDADVEVAAAQGDPSIFEAAGWQRSQLMSGLYDPSIDLLPLLRKSLGTQYVVERELGGGGMSRVFVADEAGLGRKVVIKVLPRELTGGISVERLTREIKLAASLQQANIVPVLTAGTTAGFPYYTMPFVEGLSLRERLARDGALDISDAVSIMRDVARALAFAHGRGVIHRDIKPGNILLSDRTAVVTDFGIAKAIGEAHAGSGESSNDILWQTMEGIGTPAYIAPEQASGDPDVDHRADIYSYGCVAYEMFTGKPAFSGSGINEIIRAHFSERPQLVTALRPEVPNEIAELIASCLEKNQSLRPTTANDILLALDAASSTPVTHRRGIRRTSIAIAMLAVIAAGVAGWSYYRRVPVDAGPLTFSAVPFRNAARDTSLDYRSDGIGDEILNGMAKVKGVQIVGRTSAFRFKERVGADAPDVGTIERTLGARLLLTGTMRETDGRVIVSTQLNDSLTRGEIWSDSFTRDAGNLGSITDEIVQRVARTLRSKFGQRIGVLQRVASSSGTSNPSAFDLYLIGQAQLRRRGSGIGQSITSFEHAISLDRNFARAHAALAMALDLDPFFNGTPAREVTARAIAEANRALAIDSSLADAYAAVGAAHAFAGQWTIADAEMRRAIQLDPDNASIRQAFARILIVRGIADEGVEHLQRARAVEPTSPIVSAWLAYGLYLEGHRDLALLESERAVALDPTSLPVVNLCSLLNLAVGRKDVARRLIRAPTNGTMANAAYAYAKLGDTASANRLIHEMEQTSPRPWFVDVEKASVLLARGDSSGALNALERSERNSGPMWVFFIPLADPAYDVVRETPRFAALLRRANIDARRITRPGPRPGAER
jgi:serine/threonine-protein kinase